jgi:hypothetical protein
MEIIMKIQRVFMSLLALLGILFVNASAQNTVPTMINYQGFLTDTSGQALNGSYMITFRLYDEASGDNPWVWSETHSAVVVENGLFNVLLGGVNALTAEHLNGQRYLEIKVGEEVELTPRMRLASTAYALQSDKMEPDYDSGWFDVNASTTYSKALGFTLTDLPMSIQIYWSDNAAPQMGTDEIWLVQAGQYFYANAGMNAYVEIQDASTIKIHTGQNYVFFAWRSGNEPTDTRIAATSGYYRVRLWK